MLFRELQKQPQPQGRQKLKNRLRRFFSFWLAETGASGARPLRGRKRAIRIASPPLGGYVFGKREFLRT